jgi:hypothetical protein
MHNSKLSGRSFWLALSIFVFSLVTLLISLDGGEGKTAARMDELNSLLANKCEVDESESLCTKIYLQVLSFNAESQYLDARIFIIPPSKYGTNFPSSVQVIETTDVYIDAARVDPGDLNQNLLYSSGEYLRAIDLILDASNRSFKSRVSDHYYPFDRYSVEISGSVDYLLENSENPDEPIRVSPTTIFYQYTTVVPNWSVQFDYDFETVSGNEYQEINLDYQQSGKFFNLITLSRSNLTIAIVTLLGVIFLGGALSMALLLKSILLSHKPPTLTGLVWAGSTTFTLIQTRGLMPGNPRLGVLFDLVVFYPSLVVCFVSSILILRMWLKHNNENTIDV